MEFWILGSVWAEDNCLYIFFLFLNHRRLLCNLASFVVFFLSVVLHLKYFWSTLPSLSVSSLWRDLSLEGCNRGSPGFLWSCWEMENNTTGLSAVFGSWSLSLVRQELVGWRCGEWVLTILPLLVSWLGRNVEFCLQNEQTWAELHLPLRVALLVSLQCWFGLPGCCCWPHTDGHLGSGMRHSGLRTQQERRAFVTPCLKHCTYWGIGKSYTSFFEFNLKI